MASNDDYPAYKSPLKKSKTKDSFHGEGLGCELRIAGSSFTEQLKIRTTKKIDGNIASDDEYQKEEDSDPDGSNPLQCFDFDPLPGLPKIFGLAYPVKLHRDDIFSNGCKEALKYVIEKENKKVGANLIFERIERSNMHPPGMEA
ncbi:hypothetical protein GH714_018940 [Hevea brasiliensis]|uniref:Uncharacterized protein n=1 Tax=Hevea brasiliensis TaxID=3981 RepID=A0A6A6LKJ7_HEVBR|nr:hypothetical protein GH714_018940 [Hevea brasiliensis]